MHAVGPTRRLVVSGGGQRARLPKATMMIRGYSQRRTVAITRGGLQPELVPPGAGLRVYRGGQGAPVLLLHGLGGSAANWTGAVRSLVERHHVLAVDLPGHGGSAPLRRGATLRDFAGAVASVLDHLGVGPVLVAGHSFGGQVGMSLALYRPEVVRGLLLLAPGGVSTATPAARRAVGLLTRALPAGLAQPAARRIGRHARGRRVMLGSWLVSDAASFSQPAVRALLRDLPEHSGVHVAGQAMTRDDARTEIGAVACPAMVVWGARDPRLPLADGIEIARRLGAPLRVVADCGHLVPLERPEAVVDALASLDAVA